MELLTVFAAALVDEDGRVLVQQRSPGRSMAGLWEFPGGKLEQGETPEVALARELAEELGIAVTPSAFTPVGFASEALDDRHLLLVLYLCRAWQGAPAPLDSAGLAWVRPADLVDLAMPPADRPLIAMLETSLARLAKHIA